MQDIETTQGLLSQKYEDNKDQQQQQLTKDHRKLYEENADLKNEINNLKEKSCENKKQANQLGQYLRSSWMWTFQVCLLQRQKTEEILSPNLCT